MKRDYPSHVEWHCETASWRCRGCGVEEFAQRDASGQGKAFFDAHAKCKKKKPK